MVGIATIANALPVPVLPDVSAEPHRITGAIAVALVALIVLLVGHQAELIPMPVIGGLVLVLVIGLELISVRRKDTVLACGPLPCGGRHDRDFLATTQLPCRTRSSWAPVCPSSGSASSCSAAPGWSSPPGDPTTTGRRRRRQRDPGRPGLVRGPRAGDRRGETWLAERGGAGSEPATSRHHGVKCASISACARSRWRVFTPSASSSQPNTQLEMTPSKPTDASAANTSS